MTNEERARRWIEDRDLGRATVESDVMSLAIQFDKVREAALQSRPTCPSCGGAREVDCGECSDCQGFSTTGGCRDQTPCPECAGQWRVGRKVGRTLYLNDRLVGMVDTSALASAIVRRLCTPPDAASTASVRPTRGETTEPKGDE